MKTLKQELEDRWLLFQYSSDYLFEKFDKWWEIFYRGFDPTANSLHLWNFIGFMVAIHIMRRGNKFIALTWWATWMIGDPGGKEAERNFLSIEDLDNNQKAISLQVIGIVDILKKFTWQEFKIDFVNNKDFYKNMWYLDFLREVWKYITINNMISKETVKKRIEDPNKSISYTEFSYMLLQGYDFVKLFKDENVTLQIGGQDQWGNLVTWTELIRKKYDGEANVLTWPLITDSNWKKFGKSEGNAMFLDKNKTSPYFIYQYFMNTSDEDISRYLKMLTLLETEKIDEIVKKHLEAPEQREWQKILAYKVVEIIHGTKDADLALKISDFMFWNNNKLEVLWNLDKEELISFQKEVGWKKYENEAFLDLLVNTWLAKSRWDAKKDIKAWAISVDEEKVSDMNHQINLDKGFCLLRKWKKKYAIITK